MLVEFTCWPFFLWMVASLLARYSATAFTPITRRIALQTAAMSTTSSQYWNREESKPQTLDSPIIKQAKIISLSALDDDANKAVNQGPLPEGVSLLAVGTTLDDFDVESLKKQQANVIFVAHSMVRVGKNSRVHNVIQLCSHYCSLS